MPSALAPVLQAVLESSPGKTAGAYGVRERLQHLLSRTKTIFFGPYSPGSSVNRTQTYLIMSHDNNEAVLRLQNDQPYLQFLGVGKPERVNDVLVKATGAIGGTLIPSPFYAGMRSVSLPRHLLIYVSFQPEVRNHGAPARWRYHEFRWHGYRWWNKPSGPSLHR